MDKIKEKYEKVRHLINEGDLILFHGNSLLSRSIQLSDNAYFNHIGVVGKMGGSLYIVDSNEPGVRVEKLSERVFKYTNGDFLILRSKKTKTQINKAFSKLMKRVEIHNYKYDFINGFKAMINRFLGLKLKTHVINNRVICSVFLLPYALELDMVYPLENMDSLFFPQDYIRMMKDVEIIG